MHAAVERSSPLPPTCRMQCFPPLPPLPLLPPAAAKSSSDWRVRANWFFGFRAGDPPAPGEPGPPRRDQPRHGPDKPPEQLKDTQLIASRPIGAAILCKSANTPSVAAFTRLYTIVQGVSNTRPAGHMRPATRWNAAPRQPAYESRFLCARNGMRRSDLISPIHFRSK